MKNVLCYFLLATALFMAGEALGGEKGKAREARWEKTLTLPRPKWIVSEAQAEKIVATVEAETNPAQREKMEAALRNYRQFLHDSDRYEEEQHFRLLFTDATYRLQAAKDSEEWGDVRKKASEYSAAIILTDRAFLEWRTGREISEKNQDALREAYAMAVFGKKLSEGAFFSKVASDFDALLDVNPVVDDAGHITEIKTQGDRWWKNSAAVSAQGRLVTAETRRSIAQNLQMERENKAFVSRGAPSKAQLAHWEQALHLPKPKGIISDTEGEKLLQQYDPEDEGAPARLVAWERYRDAKVLYEQEQHYRLLYSDAAYREHVLKTNGTWSLIVHSSSPDTVMRVALNCGLLAWLSDKDPSSIPDPAFVNFGREIMGMKKVNNDTLFEKIAANFDRAVHWQLRFDAAGNIVDKQDLDMYRIWDEKKLMDAVTRDMVNSVN